MGKVKDKGELRVMRRQKSASLIVCLGNDKNQRTYFVGGLSRILEDYSTTIPMAEGKTTDGWTYLFPQGLLSFTK